MKEQKIRLKDFAKVELKKILDEKSYRLKKLERELEIEAALERVRARTMAMQKSEELSETVFILFQQFKQLGENPDQATIGVINEDEKVIEYWVTMYGNQMNRVFKFSIDEPNVTNKIYKAWKENKKSLVIDLSGNALAEFMKYREDKGGAAINPGEKRRIINIAFFSKGLLNVQSNEARSEESIRLLERFASVFEQTYTRFLDLQKAEAQVRESEIQLSLERVRARTMSMQKTSEFVEVINVIGEQFIKLGFDFDWVNFSANGIDVTNGIDIWNFVVIPGKYKGADRVFIPFFDHPVFQVAYEKFQEYRATGNDFYTLELDKEMKDKFADHLFANTVYKDLPDELKKIHYDGNGYITSNVFLKDTWLSIGSYKGRPFTDEQNTILKRLANSFGQAYTRFLDLEKAEAQAKEAQIEAALERVRSRSMAMQKSEELKEVIQVVYEQFVHLNIKIEHTGFVMDYKARDDYDIWVADPRGVPSQVTVPYFDSVYYNRFNDAKENGEDFFATNLDFEEKNQFYQKLFEYVPGLPEDAKKFYFSCPGLAASTVLLENVCLYIENFSGTPYTDEENATLMRFGKVFQQTYTRFLDLLKAEAQAREAKIEAGLERVRSRAMAMQTSEELNTLIGTVFTELTKLDFELTRSAIRIYEGNEKGCRWWMANSEDISMPMDFFVKYADIPYFNEYLQGWHDGSLKWQYILEGENKIKTDDFLFNETELSRLPCFVIEGIRAPEKVYLSASFNNFGCLSLASLEPLSDEHFDILLRFAKVFDLTYTRFNDLKKAEAQAREAKIEAALERVRARTMAMYKSENLDTVAEVVFNELEKLELGLLRCGIGIINKEQLSADAWITSVSDVGTTVQVSGTESMDLHPLLQGVYDAWLTNSDFSYILKGEDLVQYYKTSGTGKVRLPDSQLILSVDEITTQYYQIAMFEAGGLFAFSANAFSEDAKMIMKRFAIVFNQSYTRFLDLQKSETAAKEAIKQAALDRIRADIASMRTTKDLERITPLIWDELIILGIPFIRCGVFIMDDEQQLIHTFLSTPDGKAIAAFHLLYNTPGNIAQVLSNWQQKKNYIDHWNEQTFTEFAHALVKQGALSSIDEYMKTLPAGGFYLHFLPFLQGMLYVGNTGKLEEEEEEIKLLQSVANAFSTAYSRYEDFNKLEAAKKQVDSTLTELQSTQKQLIQSEKMASLGELTAGIAHEIQNPLNFVNNFSDVNKELLEEMKDEMKKGNMEEVKAIANDIIENEGKINHHGKRADAIVKGMLQHSRKSSGQKEPTDINALADEYLRLSYHGLRAKDKSFNATMKTDFDESIGKINIIPQDMGRVLLNLFNNAFYACTERSRSAVNEQKSGNLNLYKPTVSVQTKKSNDKIEIRVTDNGNGIPQNIVDKIFQPFFTTKPTGEGTGLGLSLAYDIIKAHGGTLKVESKEGEFTEFVLLLPL